MTDEQLEARAVELYNHRVITHRPISYQDAEVQVALEDVRARLAALES